MARERERVVTEIPGESMTKQSFAGESDVNAIMRKYLSTGVFPVSPPGEEPRYGDFTSGTDYFECMVRVREAERIFQALPIEVQVACDHDPRKLLDLVYSEDPKDRERAEELGLVPRKPAAPAISEGGAAPVAAPAPAAPAGGTGAPAGAVSGG